MSAALIAVLIVFTVIVIASIYVLVVQPEPLIKPIVVAPRLPTLAAAEYPLIPEPIDSMAFDLPRIEPTNVSQDFIKFPYVTTARGPIDATIKPSDVTGPLKYLGTAANIASCMQTCKADPSCKAFTWYDGTAGPLAYKCFGTADPSLKIGSLSAHTGQKIERFAGEAIVAANQFATILKQGAANFANKESFTVDGVNIMNNPIASRLINGTISTAKAAANRILS